MERPRGEEQCLPKEDTISRQDTGPDSVAIVASPMLPAPLYGILGLCSGRNFVSFVIISILPATRPAEDLFSGSLIRYAPCKGDARAYNVENAGWAR